MSLCPNPITQQLNGTDMNEKDIYENVHTYYTMRLGEGANEPDAWQRACEDCEDEFNDKCNAAYGEELAAREISR